jgi:hypothetical protein
VEVQTSRYESNSICTDVHMWKILFDSRGPRLFSRTSPFLEDLVFSRLFSSIFFRPLHKVFKEPVYRLLGLDSRHDSVSELTNGGVRF